MIDWSPPTNQHPAFHALPVAKPQTWYNLRRRRSVSESISSIADVPSRHRLRSYTSDDLIVPAVRLTSIGSRAFPVAGARIWSMLPLHVTSVSSLTAFKLHLKLHLFCFSFPELCPLWLHSGPCSVCCHLGHYKILIDWLINWLIDWLIDWKQLSQCSVAVSRTPYRAAESHLRRLRQPRVCLAATRYQTLPG